MTQIPIPDFSHSIFPYLRIAQSYEVPYFDVLAYVDRLDQHWSPTMTVEISHLLPDRYSISGPPVWEQATLRTWQQERFRRDATI